jgi:hypothetical protein
MLVILFKKDALGKLHYYRIDDRQGDLFSPWTLTVSWGASPEGSRRKFYTFDSQKQKDQKIRTLLQQKIRTHQVLYSFFRDSVKSDMTTIAINPSLQAGNS